MRSYAPDDRTLTALVGDTLAFSLSAVDPDNDRLAASFTVGGAVRSSADHWTYVVDDTGATVVRGSVSDGEYSAFIEWTLERIPYVNLPPIITSVQPLEPNPTLVIGGSMNFAISASDPDSDELFYRYTVNDSVIALARQFVYHASSIGPKLVRARVSDGENAVLREWNLKVTGEPDTIAPSPVTITRAETGVNPGEVIIDWTAVGRDGMIGLPSEYEVRTAPEVIVTEDDWTRASLRPGTPAPIPPGGTMTMVLGDLQPAKLTYLAVRAIDDFGNMSPLSASPGAVIRGMRITGRVVDALTGLPIPNCTVILGLLSTNTDANGQWVLDELPHIDDAIIMRDEIDAGIGAYFDLSIPYNVQHGDDLPVCLVPNYALQTTWYTDFLQFFRSMTDIAGNPFGKQQRRWDLPIDLYVRAYARDGLDYRATIERIAAEFDAVVGQRAFNIVSTPVTSGVETQYTSGLSADYYSVEEWTSDWYPYRAVIHFRTVYTPDLEHVLEITARHELGHALGLNHSFDGTHVMVGGVAPSATVFTPDEVAVIRCLFSIPRGTDNRGYLRE